MTLTYKKVKVLLNILFKYVTLYILRSEISTLVTVNNI